MADAAVAGLVALPLSVVDDFVVLPQPRPALLVLSTDARVDGALDARGCADAASLAAADGEVLAAAETETDSCGEAFVWSGVKPRDLSAAKSPPASNANATIAAPITSLRRGDDMPTPVIVPVAPVTDGTPDNSFVVTPVRVT